MKQRALSVVVPLVVLLVCLGNERLVGFVQRGMELCAQVWTAALLSYLFLIPMRALEKRPVSLERVEEAVANIKRKLRATGEREIKSLVAGELVMNELRKLDEVAYIRFASVYRRFQDLNEFRAEIERMSREQVDEE